MYTVCILNDWNGDYHFAYIDFCKNQELRPVGI